VQATLVERLYEAVVGRPSVMHQKPRVVCPQNFPRLLVATPRPNRVHGHFRTDRHVQPPQPSAHFPAGLVDAVHQALSRRLHQSAVSRSRLVRHPRQGPAQMANQAAPTYSGLVQAARQSLVNSVDETGWKVGGRLWWLHVAVSAEVTVYAIRPGRGYEQAREILGADYPGFLVHDGWAPYYRF